MSKQKIREWVYNNANIEIDGSIAFNDEIDLADLIDQYTKDQSAWVSAGSIELMIGERWLCEFNGETIVLELDRSFPMNNEPYYFWFEPYMDDLEIEWNEVTRVVRIPPTQEA